MGSCVSHLSILFVAQNPWSQTAFLKRIWIANYRLLNDKGWCLEGLFSKALEPIYLCTSISERLSCEWILHFFQAIVRNISSRTTFLVFRLCQAIWILLIVLWVTKISGYRDFILQNPWFPGVLKTIIVDFEKFCKILFCGSSNLKVNWKGILFLVFSKICWTFRKMSYERGLHGHYCMFGS